MIGNVWEWTRSLWGKELGKPDFVYPYEPDDPNREDLKAGNDVLRVVRGGSWNFSRRNARCAYRSRNPPGARDDDIGFRVVLRSAP
jgi:formylglycine-generating enzyme required for sulfatase activity